MTIVDVDDFSMAIRSRPRVSRIRDFLLSRRACMVEIAHLIAHVHRVNDIGAVEIKFVV